MTVESPFATQDLTYPAEQTRRAIFFDVTTGGVKGSGCAPSAPGGMGVGIATGEMIVGGTISTTQGFYYVRVSAALIMTLAAASSSNPRIDSGCATVIDVAYAGSGSSTALVQAVTGTASGSPVAPSLPANSLLLVNASVPESATSINGGDLTDERVGPSLLSTSSPSAMQLISSQVLSGPEASVTFSGIPGTYNHLQLKAVGRSTNASEVDSLLVNLNSDTGTNYDMIATIWQDNDVSFFGVGATSAWLSALDFDAVPAATATAGVPGFIDLEFLAYAQTTWQKTVRANMGYTDYGTSSANNAAAVAQGLWRSTAAIDLIKLSLLVGEWATGSAFYLYGIT